jgi:hypothetical protein
MVACSDHSRPLIIPLPSQANEERTLSLLEDSEMVTRKLRNRGEHISPAHDFESSQPAAPPVSASTEEKGRDPEELMRVSDACAIQDPAPCQGVREGARHLRTRPLLQVVWPEISVLRFVDQVYTSTKSSSNVQKACRTTSYSRHRYVQGPNPEPQPPAAPVIDPSRAPQDPPPFSLYAPPLPPAFPTHVPGRAQPFRRPKQQSTWAGQSCLCMMAEEVFA